MNPYSTGRSIQGVPPQVNTVLQQMWDRINFLLAENNQLKLQMANLSGNGGGGSSGIALPVTPDALVAPGTVSGQIVAGTENWGTNAITIPATTYSLTVDQANARTLVFTHAVGGAKTITMPLSLGKMWLVLNGLSANQITFNPPGGGSGTVVAGGKNKVIVMLRIPGGAIVISGMAPDGP